jgi:hypothetical protein
MTIGHTRTTLKPHFYSQDPKIDRQSEKLAENRAILM